jgi:hypothetical protein
VLVETIGDRSFVDGALNKPLVMRNNVVLLNETINKTNSRPSTFLPSEFKIIGYEPPSDGWPWLVVIMVHQNIDNIGYERNRYSVNAFSTENDSIKFIASVLEETGKKGCVAEFVCPEI